MARFHLNLEDIDGKIAMQCQFRSDAEILDPTIPQRDPMRGVQTDSKAHQMGLMAYKFLEEHLEKLVEPEIVTNLNAPETDLMRKGTILDAPEVQAPGSLLTQ